MLAYPTMVNAVMVSGQYVFIFLVTESKRLTNSQEFICNYYKLTLT